MSELQKNGREKSKETSGDMCRENVLHPVITPLLIGQQRRRSGTTT